MSRSGTPLPSLMNFSHSIVSGGTFTQNIDQRQYNHSGERPGYARLLQKVATSALHDSVHVVDPPKCHPNTRVAIIQSIIDWGLGTDEELTRKPILWLTGGAGAGKSAIARSVAERCSDDGSLLGAFFFAAADSTRNHVGTLVASLSYQISTIFPEFREMVASIIEDDMLIFDRSIRTQFSTLLVRPLSIVLANRAGASTTPPRVVIIDGLDECSSIESQRDLLFSLQEVTNTTTLIRFLVCSRPESHLQSAFSLPRMVASLYKVFLSDDYAANHDIRVYLEDNFKQIKEGHLFRYMLPDPWPASGMVDALVYKSSGHFIYATTVVRYVDSPRHRPDQRLDAIFQLRPPFRDLPFTELDALYRLIISKADDVPKVLDILAFPVLYGLFESMDIEAILKLEHGTLEVLLADLFSIITVSAGEVNFLHKSVVDFLSEPQRAGDLYRDWSRAQLSHVARGFGSQADRSQQMGHVSCSDFMIAPIRKVLSELKVSDSKKADYFSSDILRASRQFPMFEFFKPLLLYGRRERLNWIPTSYSDWYFIRPYLQYLYSLKDVCESTRLVYWEQMRQYCECVLAVLGNNLTDVWDAHFVFAYYHLLHDTRYRLPRKLSYIHLYLDIDGMDFGAFGDPILHVMASWHRNSPLPYSDDIAKICHDVTGHIDRRAILAKSASFCLAYLCDEWRASQDVEHMYRPAKHDQHKKRHHPWHWRQRIPRRSLLGNRLPITSYHNIVGLDYISKVARFQKALRNNISYNYKNIRESTMRGYFEVKSDPKPAPQIPASSRSITGWEVRTAGDDVQEQVLFVSLYVLAEEESAGSPGYRKLFA
ncbi:hypothetical protein D9613_003566 [Agrocybe pediades]|uniref:Nephrocystin 3-like N-terminal domain-containing protein n=1 Tax=Agrocybe pediades TaxID=84607 RepID=A0A8H4QJN9_9AGAR|nr:hypothetical protein D9613_003566 [Agrocybe pediades]